MSHLLRLCFALLVGQIRHFVYVPDYGCHIRVGVHQATKERSCILWQVEPGQRSNHAPLQARKPTNAGKGFQVAWPTVNEVVARKGDALAKKLPCPVLSGKKPYVSVTR